jgi:beta-galactosidase
MVNRQKLLVSFLFLSSIVFASCNRYTDYSAIPWEEQENPPWENPQVNEINREMPRAHFIPFANVQQARAEDKWNSPMIQSLNGMWKFNLAQNPSERPYWFFKDDFDTRNWDEIKVPVQLGIGRIRLSHLYQRKISRTRKPRQKFRIITIR